MNDYILTKVMLKRLANTHDDYEMPDCPAKKQVDEVVHGMVPRFRDVELRREEVITRLEASTNTRCDSCAIGM